MNSDIVQEGSFYGSRDIAKHQSKKHPQITKVIRELIKEGLLLDTIETTYICSQSNREYPDFICSSSDTLLVLSKFYREPKPVKKYQRKKISSELRREVFERDAYRCKGCSDWHDLCIDHILPVSRGGINALENLQTLCRPCNANKSTKTMKEWEAANALL